MTAPRLPSRSSTFASQDSTSSTSSQNAALQGAALAFGRPAPPARAPSNTYTGTNGALAAAATVGTGSRQSSPARGRSPAPSPMPSSTDGRRRSVRSHAATDMPLLHPSTTPNLGLPPPQRGHTRSPSQQAASIAAARAPPLSSPTTASNPARGPSWKPAPAPKPRRLSSLNSGMSADDERDKPTDATPIAPTTSLVDMFERRSSASQIGKKPEPLVVKSSNDLPLRSPKPVRTSGGITSMFQMELDEHAKTPKPVARDFENKTVEVLENKATRSVSDSYTSTSDDQSTSVAPIAVPRSRPSSTAPAPRPDPVKSPGNKPSKPPPTPLRSMSSRPIAIEKHLNRSATSPMEAFSPSSASGISIAAQFNQMHPRRMTPSMTGDQLADAMVAGSLASSRQASPARRELPPPPPSRRQKHSTFSFSRTPSPAKTGMRKTLRQTDTDISDDSEDDKLHPYGKHKKKRHIRPKHPNKHHEGDRKRWRDAVTERERKRYEGVWAANKGLYCSFSPEERKMFSKQPQAQRARDMQEAMSNQVSDIIVRDIWLRSRLSENALETIYDLVDSERVGRLTKEEFVVGMWLIDQKLKGRKLPVQVSDTVWASVKGLQGIKIKK